MDQKLATILADVFNVNVNVIKLELTKAEVDNWDSLKQMDLVLSLERAYDLSLEITDIIAMQSVAQIIEVLEKKGVSLAN